ncbi:uncharacterized protein LOC62_02G002605 [Vanrija pseudolonga]|uniref:Uncharacterized protein n=1 Tax=Vanrija pseudolonga TaxID=143232 RepID=A0AAF0Y2G1_9TREE|nr:hypothetical protein LOC62_02G002605 [Vanrija pseudolonga]
MRLHLSLGLIALVLASAAAAPLPASPSSSASHPPHDRQLTTAAALAALRRTAELRVYSPAEGEFFVVDDASGKFWAVMGELRDTFIRRSSRPNDVGLVTNDNVQKPFMAA